MIYYKKTKSLEIPSFLEFIRQQNRLNPALINEANGMRKKRVKGSRIIKDNADAVLFIKILDGELVLSLDQVKSQLLLKRYHSLQIVIEHIPDGIDELMRSDVAIPKLA